MEELQWKVAEGLWNTQKPSFPLLHIFGVPYISCVFLEGHVNMRVLHRNRPSEVLKLGMGGRMHGGFFSRTKHMSQFAGG
jgi:hypothetical protein